MEPQNASQSLSTSAMAITGFVIGLIALLTSFLPFINNFSFFLGLLALIFSIVGLVGCARGKKKGKGLAIAALIVSLLSCVVVLWSQSVYSAAIDDAFSTTKAATATTKAATSTTTATSDAKADSATSASTTSEAKDSKSSSEESIADASGETSVSEASASAETPIEATNAVEEYAYQISIEEFTVSETYDGQPCALVTFMFTNNSDEETSFMVAIDAEAYQNGVELDTGVVSGMDSDITKHVKPGGSITVQKAYVLDDQSDVTIECTEMFAWDDVILAEATFPVA